MSRHFLTLVVSTLGLALATSMAPAEPTWQPQRSLSVRVETLDGEFEGKLQAISTDPQSPQLVLETRALPLRDVLSITFNKPIAHKRELRFELADGSVLFAGIGTSEGSDEGVMVNGTLFPDNIRIAIEGLRKVYSLDSEKGELAGPELPKQDTNDLLMTREGATFKGIVDVLARDGLVFEEEQLGSMGKLPWQQIHGISIAPLGAPPPPDPRGVAIWLEGRDGSRLAFQLLEVDPVAGKVRVHSPFTGELEVELDRVQGMEMRLGRVSYLSERDPIRVEEKCPYMSEELASHFKWQRDRSVLEKKPLRIGERHFTRGLGVHSNSQLVFALEPQDRLFQCWIGIDVIGKPAEENQPAGHVVFKVLVDGQQKVSQPMSWRDAAHRVQVDVQGGKELTLIVEMGENLHVLDRADWGDARILRE